ncbi:MAG: acylneuraminate cytidylyltransferase family protein [Rhodocyclaceae bacterium]|nr:acylneuraminate cytidylyltransferase family protein [Rhodocyclaceae bacterium]
MRDKYLAIVTARAGSKRFPGKNVRDLCGKPLFVWSVLAGLDCPQVARTIVSTDSPEYQRIAIAAGADCPWLRDPALAADETSSADVVKEVLECLGEEVKQYRALVLLQPTSPLRTAEDISRALALYESRNAPAVVSVSEAECPPAWMGQLPADLAMDEFAPAQFRNLRSQDLGDWYRLNGAVYVIGIEEFRREHGFKPQGTLAYVMPRERSIDVDTAYDFELAEFLMRKEKA